MIPGFNVKVEPGDACPPIGVPFDPNENYDSDILSSLRVLKRGDRMTIVGGIGPSTWDAVQRAKKELEQKREILEDFDLPQPTPINVVETMPMPGQPDHPVNKEYNKGLELLEKNKGTPAGEQAEQVQR